MKRMFKTKSKIKRQKSKIKIKRWSALLNLSRETKGGTGTLSFLIFDFCLLIFDFLPSSGVHDV